MLTVDTKPTAAEAATVRSEVCLFGTKAGGFGFIALNLGSPVAMGLLGFYAMIWISYPIIKITGRVVKAIKM